MVHIATLGMFIPQIGGGDTYVGGAIIPPQTEDICKSRMVINIKSLETRDKKSAPLRIILKCSN